MWLLVLFSCACTGASGNDRGASNGTAGSGANPFANAGPGASTSVGPGSSSVTVEKCEGACLDFPREAVVDTSGAAAPPANAAQLFGAADDLQGPGPCVLEPQLGQGNENGALFPRNWLRPRFRFQPAGGETLFEIRLHSPLEKNDLVAYTTATTWTLPREVWTGLGRHVLDQPIAVTIRGVNASKPGKPSGVRGVFTIAPVDARGKLVYWATTSSQVQPNTSKLVGFDVGDEGVIDALTVPQAGSRDILAQNGRDLRGKNDDPKGVPPGAVQCIGCHVSTPDGSAVAFTDHWPWNDVMASVETGSVGQAPSFLTSGASRLLNQPWLGMQTFSAAHFRDGDRIVVAAFSPRNGNGAQAGVGFTDSVPYPSHHDVLAWFDLETTATFQTNPQQGDVQQQLNQQISAELGRSFDMMELGGETGSAAAPSFSHDGTRIVYTSAEATQDGRIAPGKRADCTSSPSPIARVAP